MSSPPPADSPGLGLHIHFWQDAEAPLLTREELEAALDAQRSTPAVTEIDKNTFWTLVDQAKTDCGANQRAAGSMMASAPPAQAILWRI